MRLQLHRDPTRHQRRDRGDETAPPPATIGELMTSEVVAVPVDFDVADAARLMLDRHLTRLAVMEGEQIVGILNLPIGGCLVWGRGRTVPNAQHVTVCCCCFQAKGDRYEGLSFDRRTWADR